VLRLAAVLVAALAAALWYSRQRSGEGLTVENRSGAVIDVLEVTLAGRKTTYKNVRTGDAVTAAAGAEGDQRFEVKVEFPGGARSTASGLIEAGAHFVVIPGGDIIRRPERH
jgi:hypothetical protein